MLKTLDQSLKVLRMFTKEKPCWGIRELAQAMDINHTNIYRILETFEKHRFLIKNPETKKYSLGIAVWELGLLMYESLNIKDFLRPHLQELVNRTGESAFLTVVDGLEAITLDVVEPENKVKFSVSIGSRSPLYVGASYRAILAYLPEEIIEQVIGNGLYSYTPTTMSNPELLRKELAEIRGKGWAKSEGEYTPDVVALAVPIFRQNKVVASVTVSGPTYRMTEDVIETQLAFLKETSQHVTATIEKYQLNLIGF